MRKFTILFFILIVSCTITTKEAVNKPSKIIENIIKPSVLPTQNIIVEKSLIPSVSVTVSPTQNESYKPVINIVPTPEPSEIDVYSKGPESPPDEFKFNNGINKESYDGKILVMIDTYLLRDSIPDSNERDHYPRKIMILKESFDDLSPCEKEDFKNHYPNYTIFDRNQPLTGDDILSGGIANFKAFVCNNNDYAFLFSRIYYDLKNENLDKNLYPKIFKESNSIDNNEFLFESIYSKDIFDFYKNLKKSNKNMMMRKNLKKIVFGSIRDLSEVSTVLKLEVEYNNLFSRLYFQQTYQYSIVSPETPYTYIFGHDAFTFNEDFWVKTYLSTTLNGQKLLLDVFY